MALFREQAINHKKGTIYGEVLLIQPVSLTVLTVGILSIVVSCILFLTQAEYSRKAKVTGILVPESGVISVHAINAGTLSSLSVAKDSQVKTGDVLFSIDAQLGLSVGGGMEGNILQQISNQKRLMQQRLTQSIKTHKLEMDQLEQRVGLNQTSVDQLTDQQNVQLQRLNLVNQQYIAVKQLHEKGAIADVELMAMQARLLEQKQQQASIK